MNLFGSRAILLLATFALLLSCRKDKDEPLESNPLLIVQFPAAYLTLNQVDSAVISWQEGGEAHSQKLIQRNDSLFLPLKLLPAGQRSFQTTLYSKKRYRNQYQGIWISTSGFDPADGSSMSMQAPQSFNDPAWKPRVRLNDIIGNDATVALRPDDSYFYIEPLVRNYPKLVIERSYWNTVGGVNQVAAKTWQCQTGCAGQANETWFTDFPQRIGQASWNHISIVVVFQDDPISSGSWILNLEHDL